MRRSIAALMGAALALGVAGSAPETQASEELFRALAKRGLAPWPEGLLATAPFTVAEDGAGTLDGPGFRVRIPAETPVRLAVISVPGRVVIADVDATPGPLALTERALRGLEIGPDDRPVELTILALRPLDAGPPVAPAAPTGPASENAPFGGVPVPPEAPGRAAAVRPAAPSTGPVATVPVGAANTIQTPANGPPTTASTPEAGLAALHVATFWDRDELEAWEEALEDRNLPVEIIARTAADGTQIWDLLVGPLEGPDAMGAAIAAGGEMLAEAYPTIMPSSDPAAEAEPRFSLPDPGR